MLLWEITDLTGIEKGPRAAKTLNPHGYRCLFYELSLTAFRPWIILKAEAHPVRNGRMIVKEEHVGRIRFRIGQVYFAQNLEGLRGNLPGIGTEPVRDLESVLVGLMFDMPAERTLDGTCNEQK
jgi:hypothetical protein